MRTVVFVFFICCFAAYAQSNKGKLSGHIINKQTGEQLINANVVAQPGGIGAVSDSLGNFNLILPFGDYRIRISYIGFEPEEKTIIVSKDNPHINLIIKLEPKIIGQK